MLKFRRVEGGYIADDATRRYEVWREGKRGAWTLVVRELTVTAGVTHALNQPAIERNGFHDTKRLAVEVARQYSGLGDDYWRAGGVGRMTKAVTLAYDAEKEEGR